MKLIEIVELVPGYKTKINSVTVLQKDTFVHNVVLGTIESEIQNTPEIAEQLEGKEYTIRIKPVEVEILIK